LYQEPPEAGSAHRERFLCQLEALIEREYRAAERRRAEFFRPDLSSIEAYLRSCQPYRERLRTMLGWPLTLLESATLPSAREMFVAEDDLGQIFRVWIEVLPGLETYGLLLVPPGDGPHPLAISQHGGLGTPELCSGFFGSANYNDMSRRVLRQGIAVFAPQLLRWDEAYGPRHDFLQIDRWLKQLGGSAAALELCCLQRILDYIVSRRQIDGERIGMIGLSYGGFHALFAAALDTRIQVAVSSCFLNDRRRYSWGDWVWFDAANLFFDAEVAALVCPRRLVIEVGTHDELFDVHSAAVEARKVRSVYEQLGIPDRFRYTEHAGGHELDTAPSSIHFLSAALQA
jgi:hypothetical protein